MNDLLQLVHDTLQTENVRFLLVGGMAVSHYRPSRQTFDLDFAICDEDTVRVKSALEAKAFSAEVQTSNFIRMKSASSPFLVDFLYMSRDTFEKLWAKRVQRPIAGRTFALAAPEHLIRMKLHALQHGKMERRLKDIPDILNLMELCGWTPSSADFKEVCLKHAGSALYELITERWKKWKS